MLLLKQVLLLGAVSLVSSVRATLDYEEVLSAIPFKGDSKAGKVYDQVIEQFSAEAIENRHLLHARISNLFPDSAVTVTSDPEFQLLPYAASVPDRIIIREKEDVQALKDVVFSRAHRRRSDTSSVHESVRFAGYDIEWQDQSLQAFIVAWHEDYSLYVQWHLIGDASAAHDLIRECSKWTAEPQNVIWVFNDGFWQPDAALWTAVQKASWSSVILDEEFKDRLINDYRSFFKSEETYKSFEVPWKRGLILLGPPGNGKTISIKAIMKDVDVPKLYVKTFHTWQGDEVGIREVFQRARAEAPCVLVLEDLDSLITDMNRSFFLNEVDGLEDNDGLLLIGTTNHFERLDPALSNRPSRFDRKYNFGNPSWAERRKFALFWQHKLSKNKQIDFPDSLVDKVADGSDNFSFAYLQEGFVASLLTLAGIDDPASRPEFATILMKEINKLREQLRQGNDKSFDNSTLGFDGESGGIGGGGGADPRWLKELQVMRGLQFPVGQVQFGGLL
ncbi:P-loop containing nucleoside triphosphate hydrolase protein [Kockovaella imperatae]|uniref:p-loop containing nucleoside triphosphate hydrolase protein n=1 Tax=Kockovaella imperatae TaxID=4999 RepID=A0A1Y1UB38_9TREE|nr:P-loop containing nucleoside triphosphate hydrolase protein [Kockovaella imperatae]ORX35258.1 P-loop containing nucleoside triphosphate hydrolase protein [Kockovaella imperatae]